MNFLLFGIGLLGIMLAYIKLASKFSINDLPNHRSSHTRATIVGGGIIVPIGILLWQVMLGGFPPLLMFGLLLVSIISFIDDLRTLPPYIRFLSHVIAVGLVLWQLHQAHLLSEISIFLLIFILLFYLAWINAFNFMDGINGMMAAYSLITLSSFWHINTYIQGFVSPHLLLISIIAVFIFSIFNFRKDAICFAGDVGSIAIAFLLGYLLLRLILISQDWTYLLLFLVFGVDAGMTILERIIKRENILTPHRLHLYQLYANSKKIKHITISSIYAGLQLLMNIIFIWLISLRSNYWNFVYFTSTLCLALLGYVILKQRVFNSFARTANQE